MKTSATEQVRSEQVYSPAARHFHWWTVAFIAVQVPVGLYMVWRGEATKFDDVTNQLYSAHKLTGFFILWLVLARLVYRLTHGAPPDEPTIEPWQKVASHLNHWSLYGLLVLIPILGWLGVSLYGATNVFGLFSLPSLAAKNTDAAATVFNLHKWAAYLLIAMAAVHIAAALFHHLVRGDGVLRRMLPGLRQR